MVISSVSEEVPFSWKIPGDTVGLCLVEVLEITVEVVSSVVEVEVEVDVEVLVGVTGSSVVLGGSGVGVGVEEGEGAAFEESSPFSIKAPPRDEPELESKVTMCAVLPWETVTTQKLELPAPLAAFLLSTLPPALALISQGRPLQPPLGHSIRTPKVGLVLFKPDSSQIGFQPNLTNVCPLPSVLAPAT